MAILICFTVLHRAMTFAIAQKHPLTASCIKIPKVKTVAVAMTHCDQIGSYLDHHWQPGARYNGRLTDLHLQHFQMAGCQPLCLKGVTREHSFVSYWLHRVCQGCSDCIVADSKNCHENRCCTSNKKCRPMKLYVIGKFTKPLTHEDVCKWPCDKICSHNKQTELF